MIPMTLMDSRVYNNAASMSSTHLRPGLARTRRDAERASTHTDAHTRAKRRGGRGGEKGEGEGKEKRKRSQWM